MTRLERLVHRVFCGHWPEYFFAPISDYLDWRCCRLCERKRRERQAEWRRENDELELGL